MDQENQEKIQRLRAALHACPEVSGKEKETRARLEAFLRENTSLALVDCGSGFYAAHREPGAPGASVALRADYDALALPDGGASHLCGHDGHAAALCGVALQLESRFVGRDVFLLFQPAEETGAGAVGCCELFQKERVDEIYGAHNLPGVPLGQVTTRPGTFACASRGVTLRFTGRAAHAAYPEHGLSPAPVVGRFLCDLPALADPAQFRGMSLCTVIGVQMGEKAFGAAAASAQVWLTLRGEHDDDLDRLRHLVLERAGELAADCGLGFEISEQDVFPATENAPACAAKVLERCGGVLLKQPMRWSEDFGHYLHHCAGAFFGIGAGTGHPPLHTADYEYPDELLAPTVEAFWQLIK
ncbi:MAG: M20/M25/M40 family metallo-hydrolase [Oscillospiraceae bacterium]|nr:M20/M25/M40 family metallo-hydrolase [Oscillospiraceae bacterium]